VYDSDTPVPTFSAMERHYIFFSQPNLTLQLLNQQHKTQLQIFILHLIADFHKNARLGPEVSYTWVSKGFILKQNLQLLRMNSSCSGHCILKPSSFTLSCFFSQMPVICLGKSIDVTPLIIFLQGLWIGKGEEIPLYACV